MKAVTAWTYIYDDGEKPELVPWGMGAYWQFPIFPSRQDAREWRKESWRSCTIRLRRVTIRQAPAGGKPVE